MMGLLWNLCQIRNINPTGSRGLTLQDIGGGVFLDWIRPIFITKYLAVGSMLGLKFHNFFNLLVKLYVEKDEKDEFELYLFKFWRVICIISIVDRHFTTCFRLKWHKRRPWPTHLFYSDVNEYSKDKNIRFHFVFLNLISKILYE